MKNLRLRSIDGSQPRIDAVEEPHEPAVKGPEEGAIAAEDVTAEDIAKLSGEEAMAAVAGLVTSIEETMEAVKDDDEELAEALMSMAAFLKGAMEGDDQEIAPEDVEGEVAARAEEALKRLRVVEAGRMLSKKNSTLVKDAIAKGKAVIKVLQHILSLAEPRATEGTADKALDLAGYLARCIVERSEVTEVKADTQCAECGANIPEGATECPKCGALVADMGEAEEEEKTKAVEPVEEIDQESLRYERLAESVETWDREFESVEVVGGELVEPEGDEKPYVKLECDFCTAGVSKNGGRRYSKTVVRKVTAAGGYDCKPFGAFHASQDEVDKYGDDGAAELRRIGLTGPPAARPEERARFEESTGKSKGFIYVTDGETVDQTRREQAAGYSIPQIFGGLSHDVRTKSVTVKSADFSGRDIVDYRVVSVDRTRTPALGGLVERQVASATGPSNEKETAMSDLTPIEARKAELEKRNEYIKGGVELATLAGASEDQGREIESWLRGETDEQTPDAIEAKVTELQKPAAPAPPKQGLKRDAEAVTGGADPIDNTREELIRLFDTKGYVEKARARAEGRPIKYGPSTSREARTDHRCYESFVQSKMGADYTRPVGHANAMRLFQASDLYKLHKEKIDDRERESAAPISAERRDTEAVAMGERDFKRQLVESGVESRDAETMLVASLGQLTQDAKDIVTMTTFGELQGGHSSMFPSTDIVVSETITVPDIGQTRHHVRRQKLIANVPAVLEGAAYLPGAEPADQEETFALAPAKRGMTIELSMELASRVPGLETELATDLGESLDATDRRLGFDVLTDATNTLASGVTVFDVATHANRVNTAMSYNNVSALQADLRQQKAYGIGAGITQMGQPTVAKHLIVADELLNPAYELFSMGEDPRVANRAASAIVNPRNPPMQIWSLPLLDYGANADDYFLVADSNQSGVHLQVRYLWSGQPQRAVFRAATDENGRMLSNDLIVLKGRLIVSYGILDFRFWAGGIVP